MTQRRSPSRLFHNMNLARDHAAALAAEDQRGPEYVYATVDRKVLWAAIAFLQKMSGSPVSLPDHLPARILKAVDGEQPQPKELEK